MPRWVTIELHEKVYLARKEVLGENDQRTLKSLKNLADCYEKNGDKEKAEELYGVLHKIEKERD